MLPDTPAQGPYDDRESLGREVASLRTYLLKIANEFVAAPLPGGASPSDCVHNAIKSALVGIRDGKCHASDARQLKAWVRRILIRTLLDALSGKVVGGIVDPGFDVPDSGNSPSSEAIAREEGAILRRALESLGPRDRQILTWRHDENMSFKEIGLRLDMSAPRARKMSVPGARKAYLKAGMRLSAAYDELAGSDDGAPP